MMNPELLKRVQLFEGLSDPELAEILMLGAVKEYAKDDVIFEDGSPGDCFYVIYAGAVRISKMFENMGEEALTVLGAGDFLGEMSFFDDEPRSARAHARRQRGWSPHSFAPLSRRTAIESSRTSPS